MLIIFLHLRSKSGILTWRSNKMETISNYNCKVRLVILICLNGCQVDFILHCLHLLGGINPILIFLSSYQVDFVQY